MDSKAVDDREVGLDSEPEAQLLPAADRSSTACDRFPRTLLPLVGLAALGAVALAILPDKANTVAGQGGFFEVIKANQKHNVMSDLRAPVRSLLDLDFETILKDASPECQSAMKGHIEKIMEKVTKAFTEVMIACMKDAKGDECKAAKEAIEKLESTSEEACKKDGELCDWTETAGDVTKQEKECIPKACHGEDLTPLLKKMAPPSTPEDATWKIECPDS